MLMVMVKRRRSKIIELINLIWYFFVNKKKDKQIKL